MEVRKNIIYLSYFFEPDLGAGAFRNTALAHELAESLITKNYDVHVFCSSPNRYDNLAIDVTAEEQKNNLYIHRIQVAKRKNGLWNDIKAFYIYYCETLRRTKTMDVAFVFASSSKLMTAYLASVIASKHKVNYYLDIRDLFVENIKEAFSFPFLGICLSNIIKFIFENKTYKRACHINLNSAGFASGFPAYPNQARSYYSNGIDDYFLNCWQYAKLTNYPRIILYAGNIGVGQGLEKIIPILAKQLGDNYIFKIVGSGNCLPELKTELQNRQIQNVQLIDPVPRVQLVELYKNAHYLFLHLNSFDSFKKVLPSKLFEYAATNLPILAGVEGYAAKFLIEEVKENVFIFKPMDYLALIDHLKDSEYSLQERKEFVIKYNRKIITKNLVESIKQYLP